MSAQDLVNEQVKSLSAICELETEVTDAFRKAMLPIAERYLAQASAGSAAGSDGKLKLTKKGGAKRGTAKPKEEKLTSKNGYHFFVAAKMAEVKNAGVEAKGRMKAIGDKWKALDDAGRAPYKSMAERYNAHVTAESKTADWKARKDAIVEAANAAARAGAPAGVTVAAVTGDDDDTATVATTATTATAPAPAVAPAPVQAPAPTPAPAAPAAKGKKVAKKN